MPAYVPPHLRKPKAKPNNTKRTTRKVKFVGNATGDIDVTSPTTRYHPRHKYASPTRKILRTPKAHSLNKSPKAKPTTVIFDMPPKFKQAVFNAHPYLTKKKKTPKQHKN
jgi:hypothetical protein